MNAVQAAPVRNRSAAKAWSRALELTASVPQNKFRTFPDVIDEIASRIGDEPALLSDGECFTYRELVKRSNRYARWALAQGLEKGDTVCLMMRNRPEYLAIWLGITRVGCVVALLNTNLTGASLAHCIDVVAPKRIVVESRFADALSAALPHLAAKAAILRHGEGDGYARIDVEIERCAGEPLSHSERRPVTIEDRALYIYTSGTTGWPKAANVSHARVMQWTHWFVGMLDARASDRMYNCLPMYHSVGGVVASGAILAAGGSVVLSEKFSASQFWKDISRWDCTLVQYIGELCRYLLHAAPTRHDTGHRIRVACGNGLAPDVWERFKSRFEIPRILEFYAATEGGLSLFNVEEECGSIGRVPAYLAHRFSPVLVRFDFERDQPIRDEHGFCVRCAPNETGEAICEMLDNPSSEGSRFEGYTDADASAQKILRNVFKPGDAWFRTGDLIRKDERGFFFFVDRVGDTFRWKGENVATSEVAAALVAFPGVGQANVYGVAVPGASGRVGMAALSAPETFDLTALRAHLIDRLPAYARPLFLRLRSALEQTGTFKYTKANLVRQAYNPGATSDSLYFNHPEREAFVPLDGALYERIQLGEFRL